MHLLLTNIKQLCQVETGTARKALVKGEAMRVLPSIENAWLFIEHGKIHSFGRMSEPPAVAANDVMDMSGRTILPAWCDSHTHLVFAAPREKEFVDRINGLSYEEIARRGGGILNSARKLNETSEEELYDQSLQRLHEVMGKGTGAIEIKSGYGLNTDAELKMLRVIRKLKENAPIPIKASFLAAHAYPLEYKQDHEGYLKLIIEEMLPRVADEGLADYMDVFCEQGFFSIDDTERLLEAGWKYGLKPKIHANQLHHSGGVEVGVKHKAISVDHLECVGDKEIAALKEGSTMPTLLPAAAFFLGIQYQPARKIIDAGLPVCLATDYNPGSCPSGSVPFLLTLACTQLKMTPEEAINAVTLNGAAALELQDEIGTIAEGKRANLIITKQIPSVSYIPYDFGNNPVDKMIINGHFI
ncbi:imidazolonepropionase [Polluticoccus soli]|uniref:imidazolonepropionase n=1 Tax=Polluticoccus soli TaxID=3034150 RepID=UPI0023E20618|nr:imidazolonepropionase [Flavipsychrobacter sp. JY13-12]